MEQVESIAAKFARLQRAAVSLEIGCATGQDIIISSAMEQIDKSLDEVKHLINIRNEAMKGKKNHTVKTVKEGTKQPSNNQGTIPNPTGGSTTGSNSDRGQFDKSGNSSGKTS